jgi:hypothetical protein
LTLKTASPSAARAHAREPLPGILRDVADVALGLTDVYESMRVLRGITLRAERSR